MTRLVIVIPCSGEKLDYDPVARAIAGESPYVPAGELYVGAFHRYARQQAERLADEVLIMSAWKGLITPDFMLHPYDVTIDDPNSIVARPSLIVHQAANLGLFAPGVVAVSWCPACGSSSATTGAHRGRRSRGAKDENPASR